MKRRDKMIARKAVVALMLVLCLTAGSAVALLPVGQRVPKTALAQTSLHVSPPVMTLELLAHGTGEAQFTVVIPDWSGDVDIGVENIPLDYQPKTVWVEAGVETEVVLTFYGDEEVGSMVIVGKTTFLPRSEAPFVPGVKVPTQVIHRVGDVTPTPARSLTLSVDPPDSGGVTLNPTGGTYTSGEEVTLTAVPVEGYIFDHWSGDASGTDAEVGITMDADKSVTAHFIRVNPSTTIETSMGTIKFELYQQRAPITTANFIKLAESGFYDGLIFHRVVDDFVIQTGDPTGTGTGGSDETIVLEIDEELTHKDGAVGMARKADPNSATSQFYICDGAQHGLDGSYAVFGQVFEGMDVVRAIAGVSVDANDKPVEDVVMIKVTIHRPPGQPTNVSPLNGDTGVSPTPTLQSSAFSDPDAGDTHTASQWQITTTAGDYSSPVHDSDADGTNLTSITIPSGALNYATTYYWRARHQDDHGAWSDWSAETLFNTTGWQIQTVDSVGDVGEYSSLALDSAGRPAISYWDTSNNDLKYAHWNGASWDIQTVDSTFPVYWPSLDFDSSDNPAISYYDNTNDNLKFAWWNGSSWDIETVDSMGDVGRQSSLVFDSLDSPSISYWDYSNLSLKYAHWNGVSWDIETVDSAGNVGQQNSLALDSSDNPAISYSAEGAEGDLKYASWNGTSWEIQTVDSAGETGKNSSLTFDFSDNPAISYYDWTDSDLKYAHWNGASWDIESVDSNNNPGRGSSLALDSSGNPSISYWEYSNRDLRYAHWNGSSWDIETVDSTANVEGLTSLAFDASGNPAISYYDSTNGDLKYAHLSLNQSPNQPSNQLPLDGATDISLTPTLQSSSFSDPDAGDTHAASQWQITGAPGDYSSPVFDSDTDASNLTSISIPSGLLNYDATYYWHVRHQDNNGAWSQWSAETSFATAAAPNQPPSQPSNTWPLDGATGVTLPLILQSSAFSDPDSGDTHAASQWQITATSGYYSSPVFDSGTDTSKLTSITISSGTLQHAITYYWRVRHQDNHGAWSEWSDETQFTREGMVVVDGGQEGEDGIVGWARDNWSILAGAVAAFLILMAVALSIALRRRRQTEVKDWKDEGYRW